MLVGFFHLFIQNNQSIGTNKNELVFLLPFLHFRALP